MTLKPTRCVSVNKTHTSRNGIGEILQLMLLVLIIAVIALLLYDTQVRSTGETADVLADTTTVYGGHVTLQNLHDLSLIVPHQQNPSLVQVLIYACDYGKEEEGYGYTVSPSEPIQFQTEEDIKAVLDETIPGNYYLRLPCDKEEERVITIGEEPPANAEVLGAPIRVPLPQGTVTTAFLYRWRE